MSDRTGTNGWQGWLGDLLTVSLVLALVTGCGSSPGEGAAAAANDEPRTADANYVPLALDDWEVSSPPGEGLDAALTDDLYHDASRLDTLYSVLVVKNGKLVAEQYFNEGAIDEPTLVQSVTKSYVSALVGLALEQGCLTSLDQPLLEFFPEYADQIEDPRKETITVRHLLQMRSGYPWEESHPDLWAGLLTGDWLPLMVYYPLATDPGTAFHYSNASSNFLGAIVARACDVDLRAFAEEHLFAPLSSEPGDWWDSGVNEYPMGSCCLHVTARDAAKFGLLYLNDGVVGDEQVIPADWVRDSLRTYSEDAWTTRIGPHWDGMGYGYQWWSAQVGEHAINFAWGHGGQVIALVHDLDMVVVATADPFFQQHDGTSWRHEKANLNLVADFIASLPAE